MKIEYHPDFAQDVLRLAAEYGAISPRLRIRFRVKVEAAIRKIKTEPTSAGHLLNTGWRVIRDVRRRNLKVFPYFVLYGLHADVLVFGAIIPSASDPLTWLNRFTRPADH